MFIYLRWYLLIPNSHCIFPSKNVIKKRKKIRFFDVLRGHAIPQEARKVYNN